MPSHSFLIANQLHYLLLLSSLYSSMYYLLCNLILILSICILYKDDTNNTLRDICQSRSFEMPHHGPLAIETASRSMAWCSSYGGSSCAQKCQITRITGTKRIMRMGKFCQDQTVKTYHWHDSVKLRTTGKNRNVCHCCWCISTDRLQRITMSKSESRDSRITRNKTWKWKKELLF